jgi:low temperature requirement protein LtrA
MAVTAVEQEHRVTPRELFFDLVFVVAFTQVATLLADDPTLAGSAAIWLALHTYELIWWREARAEWRLTLTRLEHSSPLPTSYRIRGRQFESGRA